MVLPKVRLWLDGKCETNEWNQENWTTIVVVVFHPCFSPSMSGSYKLVTPFSKLCSRACSSGKTVTFAPSSAASTAARREQPETRAGLLSPRRLYELAEVSSPWSSRYSNMLFYGAIIGAVIIIKSVGRSCGLQGLVVFVSFSLERARR